MRKKNSKPIRTYGRHRKRQISLLCNQSTSKLSFVLENEYIEKLCESGIQISTKGNSSGTAFDRLLKESNKVNRTPRRTNLWISSNSSQSSESARSGVLFKSPGEKTTFKSCTHSPISVRKRKITSKNYRKKNVPKANLSRTDVKKGKKKPKKTKFHCIQKHNTRSVNWSDIEKYSFVLDKKECNDPISKPQKCLVNFENTYNPKIIICDVNCTNSPENRLDNTTNNEESAFNDKYISDIITSDVDRHSLKNQITIGSPEILETQYLYENTDMTANNDDCAYNDKYKSDNIPCDVDRYSFSQSLPMVISEDSSVSKDLAEKLYLENQSIILDSPEVLKTQLSYCSPSPFITHSQKFMETDKIITSTPFVLPAMARINCFNEEWSHLSHKENSSVLCKSSLTQARTNRCNSHGSFNHIKLALDKIVDRNHHQSYILPSVNNYFEMIRKNANSKCISSFNSESLFKVSYNSRKSIQDVLQTKNSENYSRDTQKSLSNISANENTVDRNSKSSYDLSLPTPKQSLRFKTSIPRFSSDILNHYKNCNKDASSVICIDCSKEVCEDIQLISGEHAMTKTRDDISDPSLKNIAHSHNSQNLDVSNEFINLSSFTGFGSNTLEEARRRRIQHYRDLCKSFIIALSPLPLHFTEQSSELSTSPEEKVLAHCSQEEPISFSKAFDSKVLSTSEKIGEGVYGEVYRIFHKNGTKAALKLIPVEGNFPVNGETQKNFSEILPEIVISQELSILNEGLYHTTSNFIKVSKVSCVKGKYPRKLLQEWDKYNRKKESLNDRPDIFGPTQLFIAFESADGGIDLETVQLKNAVQATSIFTQVACTLAVAEQALEFEHRDLHWGNILISEYKCETVEYMLDSQKFAVQSCGVFVSIIDFTLSRLSKDGCTVFADLHQDPTLFTGEGDYQFDIYRLMKEHNNNEWESFKPYSNVLWLHYLIVKLCTGKKYKNGLSTIHKEKMKQLKMWRDNVLQYESATDFVNNSGIVSRSTKSVRNITNHSESKENSKAPKASKRVTRVRVKKNISVSVIEIDDTLETNLVTTLRKKKMNSVQRNISKKSNKEKENQEKRLTRSCIKKSKPDAELSKLLRMNVRI